MTTRASCEFCGEILDVQRDQSRMVVKCERCGNSINFPLSEALTAPLHSSEESPAKSLAKNSHNLSINSNKDLTQPGLRKPAVLSVEPDRLIEMILASFEAEFPPVTPTIRYRIATLIVAVVMVLLPLIYVALVVLTAYGLYWHAVTNIILLIGPHQGRSGKEALIIFFGPLVTGSILFLFMIKPLFARPANRPPEIELSAIDEPILHLFVQRLCDAIQAPRPSTIEVNCEANAAAFFHKGWKGFWRNDLGLQIGLPLITSLNTRQFAGVLAHEFGHFSQRAGMRLSYVIRAVNIWFARVIYGRDSWDEWLDSAKEVNHNGMKLLAQTTRLAIWMTRRLLWVLMIVGHAVSCALMRQMEYDADKYESGIAGSSTYEGTARCLAQLCFAEFVTRHVVATNFKKVGIPDDLPLCVAVISQKLPAEVKANVEQQVAEQSTGWFDTHPTVRERIGAAKRQNEKGIFRLELPSTVLLKDANRVATDATRLHFQHRLGSDYLRDHFVDAKSFLIATGFDEDVATEQSLDQKANEPVETYQDAPDPTRAELGSSNTSQLTISDNKLKVLRPDLYRTAGFSRFVPKFLWDSDPDRNGIKRQLLEGDKHAAVVLSVSPLLVAVYCDAYDCVAMLELPLTYANKFQLEVGFRLLSANFYAEAKECDQDLIVNSNRYGKTLNFRPLIADFITDEMDVVAAIKSEIPEREWQRTEQLGYEYLSVRLGIFRDARTGFAPSPAAIELPQFRYVIFGLFMFVAAIVVEIWTVEMFRDAITAQSWPTTKGTIKRSEIIDRTTLNPLFEPKIEYEFTVNEKVYSSSSVRRRDTTSKSKHEVTSLVSRFEIGAEVPVYYDPANPSQSYLITGVGFVDYMLIITPVVYGVLMAGLFLVLAHQRFQMKAARHRARAVIKKIQEHCVK